MQNLATEMGFKPRMGVWELTLRCNLQCIHCGSRAGSSRGDELSLDEMLRVADQLAELGNERITLSGGEPMLFKDWHVLGRRLSDNGCAVNMISNGYAVTERNVDQAIEAGLKNMGFSIDGDERVHNLIRGRDDSYQRVLDAFDLCREKGMRTAVVTHINRLNLEMLDDVAQTLIDHGVTVWQVQLGFDAGNLSDHPELLINASDLKMIIPKVADLKVKLKKTLRVCPGDDMGYYTEEERTLRQESHPVDFWTGCQAGMQVIGIEANGNIKGCLSMQSDEFIEGNIRDESLADIWLKDGNFAYTRGFKPDNLGGFCTECQYMEYCRGGCSWKAHLHGKGTGKFANRYCLYQVHMLEERARQKRTA